MIDLVMPHNEPDVQLHSERGRDARTSERREDQPMRVVITNTQLYNGGDAAIVLGIIRVVREAFGDAATITIFDPNADGARTHYPELRIEQMAWHTLSARLQEMRETLTRFAPWLERLRYSYGSALLTAAERRAFEIFKNADLIISTGGTYLVEHYNLRPRFFELYLAAYARRPLILFTQSLGPFLRAENRRAIREICAASRLILLRDERSAKNLADIGVVGDKVRVTADAAFALADPATVAAAGSVRNADIRRVAVSVRDWTKFECKSADQGMRDYLDAVRNAVEWLVGSFGAEVTFLSTCQGIPQYWANDAVVAEEIVASLTAEARRHATVDHDFHAPKELMEMLRGFDLVISTRMHMAILALSSGVPVLPIAYEFKTEELFANELGMAHWVFSIDDLTPTAIADSLPNFMEQLPGLRTGLFGAVERLRRDALGMASELRRFRQSGRPALPDKAA
jgi:colanic acid/amylovoran biosynthesis protein